MVIITLGRSQELGRTLDRLRALPEQPEVVVVDNASSGAGPTERPGVRFVQAGRNLGGAARNLGVAHTNTPYIAFSDDDSWWAPGALSRTVEVLDAEPDIAVVVARVLVGPEQREDPVCAELAASPLPRRPGLPGPSVLGFLACGSVVRREAFVEAGGFEERLCVGGEEELLAIDLCSRGWELVYLGDVVAHHHPSPVRDVGRRMAHQTRNALWTTWLRRPARRALTATWQLGRSALRHPAERAGLVQAVRGLPWVMRQRRVVPPEVEERLRLLD